MKKILLLVILFCVDLNLAELHAQVQHKKKHATRIAAPKDADKPIYKMRFPKNKSATTITAYMLGIEHPVTFIVNVTHGKMIKAEVKEMVEPANIRISQIFTPDGMSDGPFSHTLTYPIKHKGVYKIIVGGDNMEGDDWKGVFTMHIALQ